MKSPVLLLLGPLLLGLALSGCNTETGAGPAPGPPPAAFAALQKGQTAAQVRALLGEPVESKPYPAGGLVGEVWVYHRKISERDQEVPIGSREVPVTNPLTGVTSMANEPVYATQTITVIETVELLMVEQRLIEWKSHRLPESRIHPH